MADFNPDAPCVIGNQWAVTSRFHQAVTKDAEDRGTIDVAIASTATETVDGIWLYVAGGDTPLDQLAREGWYAIEVYEADDLTPFLPTTSQYVPSADTGGASTATRALPSGGDEIADLVTSPLYTAVDNLPPFSQGLFEGVQTQDLDWITVIGGLPGFTSFYYLNIVGDLTGEQILVVKNVLMCDMYGSGKATRFRPFLLKGARVDNGEQTLSGAQPEGGRRLEGSYFADPGTRCSWDVAEFEDFDDANADAAAGFTMDATGDDTNYPAVLATWLEVLHRPEARVAVGCETQFEPGWNLVELEEPDGTPGWPKVNGTDYVVILRRRGGSIPDAGAAFPVLLGEQPNNVVGTSVTFDGTTHAPIADNGPVGGGPAMVLDINGVASVDSQPYTILGGLYSDQPSDPYNSLGLVDVDHTLDQVLTAQANDDYGFVSALIAAPNGFPTNQLEIRLMNAAGTVTVAGPIVIEPEELTANGGPPPPVFRLVEDHFPVIPTLVSGTDYRLRFGSSTTAELPWRVQALAGDDPPIGAEAQTYGGTDETVFMNSLEFEDADLAATLAIVPDTPQNLTALADEESDCIAAIDLDWDNVVLGCGSFGQWEVDRSDDGGVTWQRIFEITTQAITSATDYESVRNNPTQYRVRVRRTDGTPSLWSDTASATAEMTCCGYIFASNHYPDLTVWYDDLEHRSYDFLDDEETRLVKLAGRDMQVAFFTLDYRGEQLEPTMLIAAEGGQGGTVETVEPGVRTFDPLREIAGKFRNRTTGLKSIAPSIAVMSAEGDRWFAHVQTPRGERHEPDGAYTMPIVITEVSPIPAPFDTTPPPS